MALQTNKVQTFRSAQPLHWMRLPALISLGTLGLLWLVSEPEDRWIVGIVALVLAFSLAVAYWLMTRTRLEIGPQGITYHGIGFRVHSRWDNITGYAKRVQGVHEPECLILSEPGLELSRWMRVGYGLMPVANAAALLNGRGIVSTGRELRQQQQTIPVEVFDQHWREGEIGALVRQYAPHVFADKGQSS